MAKKKHYLCAHKLQLQCYVILCAAYVIVSFVYDLLGRASNVIPATSVLFYVTIRAPMIHYSLIIYKRRYKIGNNLNNTLLTNFSRASRLLLVWCDFVVNIHTNFEQNTFSDEHNFEQNTFSDEHNFEQNTFSDEHNFEQNTFSDEHNFEQNTFPDEHIFEQNTFPDEHNFEQIISQYAFS